MITDSVKRDFKAIINSVRNSEESDLNDLKPVNEFL